MTRNERPDSPTLGYQSTKPSQTSLRRDDHNVIRGESSNSERASSDDQQPKERSIKAYEAARQAQTLPLLMTAQHVTEEKSPTSGDQSKEPSHSSSRSATKMGEGIERSPPPEADKISSDTIKPSSEKLNSALLMRKLEGVRGKSSKPASKFKPESKHVNHESRSKDVKNMSQLEGQTSSQASSSRPREGSYFPEGVVPDHPASKHSTTTDKAPAIIPRSSTMHMPVKGSPLKTMISPLVSPSSQLEGTSKLNDSGSLTADESDHGLDPSRTASQQSTEPATEETTISSPGVLTEPLNQASEDPVMTESKLPARLESINRSTVPELLATTGTQVEQDDIEAAANDALETAPQDTAQESIATNQIMTSADILAGRLPLLEQISENTVPPQTEDTDTPAALTQAEKDFMEEEIQDENLAALVPAPKVITARDIRKRRYDYTDFPHTLKSAVPRVETHPGAITSATTGEIVPFADEQIHLEAGETLVDGTGRTWNQEGVVEPGKDLEGRFLVYEVDLNQVRKTYGSIPAILPWVSSIIETIITSRSPVSTRQETYVPETPSETLLTPSYQTGDDWSGDEMSEMSLAPSGLSTPAVQRGPRASRAEEAAIDRQLMLNDRLDFIEEDDDDDVPLDDMDLRALEEEEERGEVATPLELPTPGQTTNGMNTPR